MTNIQLKFNVPIKENTSSSGDFLIKGTAINAVTTDNGHKFLPEELERAAVTMNGIPLLVDHDNSVDSIAGRVKSGFYDSINKKIDFEAKVVDKVRQDQILNGLINSVSIGATVSDIKEDEDGSIIPVGIKIRELSLVAVPADAGATFSISSSAPDFSMALKEAYNLSQSAINSAELVERRIKKQAMENDKNTNVDESLKQELETLKTLVAEYKAKERKDLEQSYNAMCDKKGVAKLDVTKLEDSVVKMLISQLNGVKEADLDEDESDSSDLEENEDSDEDSNEQSYKGFKLEQSAGSIRGGAISIVREY